MPEDLPPRSLSDSRFAQHRYLVPRAASWFLRKWRSHFEPAEVYHWGDIGLWRACIKFQGPEEQFPFYAAAKIRGNILDQLRTEYMRIRRPTDQLPIFVEYDDNYGAHTLPTVEQDLDVEGTANRLSQLLSKLTPIEQEVIHLRYYKGLKLHEIGNRLGVSEARVCQIKAKAHQKLRLDIEHNATSLSFGE